MNSLVNIFMNICVASESLGAQMKLYNEIGWKIKFTMVTAGLGEMCRYWDTCVV